MGKPAYTLITGASSGIGKEIAWYCGSLGMNLILVSLPDEALNEVALAIAEKHNIKTVYFETDLIKPLVRVQLNTSLGESGFIRSVSK